MKSNSDDRPFVFHPLGDGSWHYNYNIKEVLITTQDGEEKTIFDYETVHFWGNPEYATLVSLVIREKHSVDSEIAILRQRESKPEQFEEYNMFCEEVKSMVKNDLNLE